MQCRSLIINARMHDSNRTDQRSEVHANKVMNYLGEISSFMRPSLHNNSCENLTPNKVNFMCIISDDCENAANS